MDGVPHGHGTATNMAQAYTYTGQWVHGWRVHGRETHTDWTYEGQYLVDEFHGRGVHEAREAHYKGIFDEGHFRHGTVTYPDGTVYTGQWSNYKMNGRGTRSQADGHTYSGEWCEGYLTDGEHLAPNGRKYVGEFSKGVYEGRGTLIRINGTKCTGRFRNGRLHGSGTLHRVGGSSAPFIWQHGRYVSHGSWERCDSICTLPVQTIKTTDVAVSEKVDDVCWHHSSPAFFLVLCQIRTHS